MNARILELYKQAFGYYPAPIGEPELEKFAELIIRECASYMYEYYPHSRYEVNYMRKYMGDPEWNNPIEKRSGVEE